MTTSKCKKNWTGCFSVLSKSVDKNLSGEFRNYAGLFAQGASEKKKRKKIVSIEITIINLFLSFFSNFEERLQTHRWQNSVEKTDRQRLSVAESRSKCISSRVLKYYRLIKEL